MINQITDDELLEEEEGLPEVELSDYLDNEEEEVDDNYTEEETIKKDAELEGRKGEPSDDSTEKIREELEKKYGDDFPKKEKAAKDAVKTLCSDEFRDILDNVKIDGKQLGDNLVVIDHFINLGENELIGGKKEDDLIVPDGQLEYPLMQKDKSKTTEKEEYPPREREEEPEERGEIRATGQMYYPSMKKK